MSVKLTLFEITAFSDPFFSVPFCRSVSVFPFTIFLVLSAQMCLFHALFYCQLYGVLFPCLARVGARSVR